MTNLFFIRLFAVIQINLFIRRCISDRRMNIAFLYFFYTGHKLHGSGRTKQMSDHRLGGINTQVVCMRAKCLLDRSCFKQIVMMRRCSMCVDIRNIFRLQSRILHRICHRFRCTCSVFSRRSNMIRIRCASVSGHFRINSGSAFFRMLQFFQNHNAGAFAHNKSAAVFVKRKGTTCRIILCR